MMKLKCAIAITIVLGILAIVAMGLAILALNDIYHGEADLRMEWWMVRILFLVFSVFIATTFFTIRQVRKSIPNLD